MPKIEVKGIDDYISMLNRVSKNTEEILNKALYEGAGVMANEVKNNIEALSAVKDEYNLKVYASNKNGNAGGNYKLSETQKKGLLDGLGIAPFDKNGGVVDTHIGFDGYNGIKTKKYPKGQPNVMIARIVESGSSYFRKTPFIRKAVKSGKTKAEETMAKVIDDEISRLKKE